MQEAPKMLQQLLRNRLLCIVLALWAVITYSRMYLASHLMPFWQPVSTQGSIISDSLLHQSINDDAGGKLHPCTRV